MKTIYDLTREAFREGGCLQRRMGGEWRASQEEFALWYAHSLDDPPEAHRRDNSYPRARLSLGQAEPGVGKSLAYLIPLHFLSVLRGQRSIVSTYTTHLRAQIANSDAAIAAAVVEEVCRNNDVEHREVRVKMRESFSGRASYTVAKRLAEQGSPDPKEADLISRYFNFVRRRYLQGEAPRLEEWTNGEDGVPRALPGIGVARYGITVAERQLSSDLDDETLAVISPAIRKFTDEIVDDFRPDLSKSDSGVVDIIVTTHAMLMVNNMLFGNGALNTHRKMNSEPIGAIMIDEADLLLSVSLQFTDRFVYLRRIEEILADFRSVGAKSKTIQGLRAALRALEHDLAGGHRGNAYQTITGDSLRFSVSDKCRLLSSGLLDLLLQLRTRLTVVQEENVNEAITTLHLVQQVVDGPGRASAEQLAIQRTDTEIYSRLQFLTGKAHYGIGAKPGKSGWLPSRLWRNINVHAVERIAFASGTLSSLPSDENFAIFKHRIGINKLYDNINPDHACVEATGHGMISKLVVCDPSIDLVASPSEAVQADDLNRENSAGTFVSPTHCEFVARSLRLALATPVASGPERTLVLFSSGASRDLTASHLSDLDLIIQANGVKAASLMRSFQADPKAMFFGIDWHGVNFVDERGKTLIGRVIITRTPLPPANHITINYTAERRNNAVDAAAKIIQGIGRGIRNPEDRPEVWILDPRWSLPRAMQAEAQRRKVALHSPRSRPPKSAAMWRELSGCIPERLLAVTQYGLLRDHLSLRIEDF